MSDTLDQLALLGRLADQIETFRQSDGWQRWLCTAARFRTYSVNNQLLIQYQRPDATYVAGFHTWRSLGRHVKKGEKGIRILAPMARRAGDGDTDGEVDHDGTEGVLIGFKAVSVFDVSQTEGEPFERPSLAAATVPNSDELFRLLVQTAQGNDICIAFQSWGAPGLLGYWSAATRTITLDGSQSSESRVCTMLHELAHAIDLPTLDAPGQASPNFVLELVAESVAYIVGTGLFGIEMNLMAAQYLTAFRVDRQVLHDTAARVLDVARRLEDMISDYLVKSV